MNKLSHYTVNKLSHYTISKHSEPTNAHFAYITYTLWTTEDLPRTDITTNWISGIFLG